MPLGKTLKILLIAQAIAISGIIIICSNHYTLAGDEQDDSSNQVAEQTVAQSSNNDAVKICVTQINSKKEIEKRT